MLFTFKQYWVFLNTTLLSASCLAAQYYPNALISETEHIMVDAGGFNDVGFQFPILPCDRPRGAGTGFFSSAGWLRITFHDGITHDAGLGTGGLDGSLAFKEELNRLENAGNLLNILTPFTGFVDAVVSMADLIALAGVTAVGQCMGPIMDFRAGRLDAQSPNDPGVPEPSLPIRPTLQAFQRAGFSQQEAITIVGCAHTFGGVHAATLPGTQIVPASSISANNTSGASNFDGTPANPFDQTNIQDYIHGRGTLGGPLVTSFNFSMRSDARLFGSDRNFTIKNLASQPPQQFQATCKRHFEKLINTVPRSVRLTDVISPIKVKPLNITLDLDQSGTLLLQGTIRILASSSSAPLQLRLDISTQNFRRPNTVLIPFDPTKVGATEGFLGQTAYYQFSAPIGSSAIPTSFEVSGPGIPLSSFHISNELFMVPALSSLSGSGIVNAKIAAAVLEPAFSNRTFVQAIVSVPTPRDISLTPSIQKTTITLKSSQRLGSYNIYTGVVPGLNQTLIKKASADVIAFLGGRSITDPYNKLAFLTQFA